MPLAMKNATARAKSPHVQRKGLPARAHQKKTWHQQQPLSQGLVLVMANIGRLTWGSIAYAQAIRIRVLNSDHLQKKKR